VTPSDDRPTKPLRYRVDRWIRAFVMRVIGWCVRENHAAIPDLSSAAIGRILLVRANFRMGNAVLALPAVTAFRKHFPEARIDFVGSPVSELLFQNQPLNHHYVAPRRFPRVIWQYPALLRRLRANRYDLAVDVSCSQSGVGSFITGLSGASIRAGLAGKWDQLFNLKFPKLRDGNKYRKLTELLTAMHLAETELVGSLAFSPAEKIEGLRKFNSVIDKNNSKIVGVFVGGRKLRGKRWPLENFIDLINGFERSNVRVVVFLGPEENDLADSINRSLASIIPIVCEPSVRKFAAIISNLDLFVCCDSGPMHLACAVGVPVVAIFQQRDVARWAPPPARVVYGAGIVDASEVLRVALEELSIGLTDAYPITSQPVNPAAAN